MCVIGVTLGVDDILSSLCSFLCIALSRSVIAQSVVIALGAADDVDTSEDFLFEHVVASPLVLIVTSSSTVICNTPHVQKLTRGEGDCRRHQCWIL